MLTGRDYSSGKNFRLYQTRYGLADIPAYIGIDPNVAGKHTRITDNQFPSRNILDNDTRLHVTFV